jgi:prolyl oligopeptidase
VKSQAFRTFHGTVVAEPFRWLEDSADPSVQAWAEEQQRRTEEFLSGCAERDRCREFLAVSHPSLDPVWICVRGSLRFRLARRPGLSQPVLCVSDGGAAERTLVDPNPDGKVIEAEYLAVSRSGRYVAFAQSAAGDVRRAMRICEVATARIVDASAVVTAVPMFAWLPDESGFFYTLFRQLFEDDGSGDVRADGLYLHGLGADWRDDSCIRRHGPHGVRLGPGGDGLPADRHASIQQS